MRALDKTGMLSEAWDRFSRAAEGSVRVLLTSLVSGATLFVLACPALGWSYFNDFETPVGAEWSSNRISETPGGRGFLGEFGNETITLTLNIPAGAYNVTLDLDLYILHSWDGNDTQYGPDIWSLAVSGASQPLLVTTFSNCGPAPQAYPDSYPSGSYPPATAATETSSLGYNRPCDPYVATDTVYSLSYSFPYSGSQLTINFVGSGNTLGLADESWGIDNVSVTLTPVCDFSSGPWPLERCFGGIGPGCGGVPAVVPFIPDDQSCLVDGWMSAGSILHDQCCHTYQDGYCCGGDEAACLLQGKKKLRSLLGSVGPCKQEWKWAEADVLCARAWRKTDFGPYPAGIYDDLSKLDLRAPRGAPIDPTLSYLCKSGGCQLDAKGKAIIVKDDQTGCRYCTCR